MVELTNTGAVVKEALGSKYTLYSYIDENGEKRFRIGPDAEASSLKEVLDSVVTDFELLMNIAVKEGIFFTEDGAGASKTTTVLRCEVYFELWRLFGAPEPEGSVFSIKESDLDQVAGRRSYYRKALSWFLGDCEGGDNLLGLYTWRDVEGPITWAELAYLVYFILKADKTQDWSTFTPGSIPVTAITETVDGCKTLVERFADYKQASFFDNYISDIRDGKRYLPLPVFCAFRELKAQNVGIPNDSGDSWILREVSRNDFKNVLEIMGL